MFYIFLFLVFFLFLFFFFNDTATTEIYTLSLHDALPICACATRADAPNGSPRRGRWHRSEEHTSELQSRQYLVCRLLLEKKKKKNLRSFALKKKKKERKTLTDKKEFPLR